AGAAYQRRNSMKSTTLAIPNIKRHSARNDRNNAPVVGRIIPNHDSGAKALGRYSLATGEAAAHRLRILHQIYGPGTQAVLQAAGLKRGMRVADIGCGVGMVTLGLSELVGRGGRVTGIDMSAAQLEQARAHMDPAKHSNISLVRASA